MPFYKLDKKFVPQEVPVSELSDDYKESILKQDIVDEKYFISTVFLSAGLDARNLFESMVFGYRDKKIMYGKQYKVVKYNTYEQAIEGHKKLKAEFGS